MKLKRILATVLALAMVLSMMSFSVLADDANVVVLGAGTYPWSNDYVGKTVKAADGAEVVLDMTVNGTPGLGGADVTFEGITFNWSNENYKGLQHSGNLTYNNCEINGQVFLYGASETFNNCTFNQSSSDAYNVWTYGAKEVSFNNCTFNSAGKSVLVYHESQATSVEVENTTFNASTSVKGKAAIEIDTSLMNGNTTVTVDEATTANGFSEETISGNSLWNVKKDPAVKESTTVVSVAEETVYAKVVDTEGNVSDPVANVNGTYYKTLEEAIKAANSGDTVTLVEDVTEDVTIGKSITIDGADKTYTGKMNLNGSKATVTIKNVNFDGKGYNGYAVESKGAYYITIVDCTAKDYGYGFVQVAKGSVRVTVKNVTVSDCNYGLKVDYSQEVVIENVDLDCAVAGVLNSNYGEKTITIKDSDISILGTWTRNDTTKSNYVFEGDNSIDKFVVDEAVDTFHLAADSMLTAPAEITLTTIAGYQVTYSGGSYRVAEENKVVDEIAVTFEKASSKEGELLYNINLKAADDDIINRLNSVDLTFVLTQIKGANDFAILPSNEEVVINPVDNSKVHYEFHYNGKDGVKTDCGNVITIGQVKFTGYGEFNFAVDESVDTNEAHATKIFDNVVDTFVPGGASDDSAATGELIINTDINDKYKGTISETIAIPTRELTINIDFPNKVEDNAVAYQDMKVEITGNIDGVNKTVTYDLGGNMVNGSYVVKESKLVLNNAYTVTVSGAGYRTARYTVTMTEDKTIRFWNNVMDNDTVVEEDKHSETKNFLAGDIVKDNKINIYDLSAVVSYFSTQTVDKDGNILAADYAKYDLNRDGVIDSKDVAYVLVSWGE